MSNTKQGSFTSLAEAIRSLLVEFSNLLGQAESFEQAHVELVSCLDFESDDQFVALSEADGYLAFSEALEALRELAQDIEGRLWRTGRARTSEQAGVE